MSAFPDDLELSLRGRIGRLKEENSTQCQRIAALERELAEAKERETYPTLIEAVERLTSAGMGKPGKPNTLLAMVIEVVAECARLRKALEDAPHGATCINYFNPDRPCNCWKSKALASAEKGETS